MAEKSHLYSTLWLNAPVIIKIAHKGVVTPTLGNTALGNVRKA